MPLELQLIILGCASIVTGVLSGISGGGAGMVMVPLAIAVGLPPQTAVGTMKLAALGASVGGLSVFAKSGHIRKDILRVMIPIIIVVGVLTPFIFQQISGDLFQKIIGVLMLALVPTLFIPKSSLKPSRRKKGIGYVLYSGILMLQALFGAGTSMLANFVLILLLGTSKIEANATKRAVTACLVPLTFIGLLITGFVSLPHGLVLLVAQFIGTHIGSKIAVKSSDRFVTYAMAIIAFASGIWLLLA